MDLLKELPLFVEFADEFDNTLANPEYQPPEPAEVQHLASAEGQPPADWLAREAIEGDNLEDLQRHLEGSAGLIHLAVKSKAKTCLQRLLQGQSPDAVDSLNAKNQTPLYVAVTEGWLEGVELLLKARADILKICGKAVTQESREQAQSETNRRDVETSAENKTGPKNALQLAVCLDSTEILRAILVEARLRDNFTEIVNVQHLTSKMTPLLIAVSQSKLEFVELLMRNGADIKALDKDGQSALHWAVMRTSLPIVKALYDADRKEVEELATWRCKGKFEGTPLSLAVYLGHLEIVKYLEKTVKASLLDRSNVSGTGTGISADKINCNVLHLASMKSTQKVTDYFTKHLPEVAALKGLVNEKTEDGCTPLSFALRKHHIDFAHALLASGADLSAQSSDGQTDMGVLICHLPSAPKFMTDVLDRSIKKHERHSHVAVNYTVFMPTCYCFNSCDSMPNGVVTAIGNGGVPSNLQVNGIDKKDRLNGANRRNGRDGILAASSSPDDQEMQPLAQIVPPQSEAVGTDQQVGHVAVDIPNVQSGDDLRQPESSTVAAHPRDVAHNHFGVLKELLKLGKSRNHMKILEHPLVESYLYLHWRKISGLFALLLALNVVFALLLSVSAILAWVAIDDDDSLSENHNITFGDSVPSSSGHHPQSLAVFLLNIINVCLFMLPLVVYEIKCLWHYDRPWKYWLETALKFVCFLATTCWLVTGSSEPVFVAIILAWIQVTVLILEMRQCHGCGRLIIYFIKEVLKFKGLVFGLVTAIASVYISSGGFSSFIKIDTGIDEQDHIWYSTIISLMILICNITFFFFLLLLAYALKTFSDEYPHREKVGLMVHQIEFLEVYEKYLLGKKPFKFSCLKGWLQSWTPMEDVRREYFVYSDSDQVPSDKVTSNKTTSDPVPKATTLIFPEELHRDIIIKGQENRENIMVQLKAVADAEKKKSEESKEQKRVVDDSKRIKNLEKLMVKRVAGESERINHLEAAIKKMMEHAAEDGKKMRNMEKMMEKMLQHLSRSSENESES